MTIRELVEAFRKQAASWGRTLRMFHAHEADRLEKDLLAAIDRLEAKAVTAKAESDAWRAAFDPETGRQTGDASDCRDVVSARAATDEAWKPENKEAQQ